MTDLQKELNNNKASINIENWVGEPIVCFDNLKEVQNYLDKHQNEFYDNDEQIVVYRTEVIDKYGLYTSVVDHDLTSKVNQFIF